MVLRIASASKSTAAAKVVRARAPLARKDLHEHLLAWLLLPFAAAFNGTVRDLTYGTMMSETVAHSVSVIPLLFVIVAWAAFLAARRGLSDARASVIVGIAWCTMTIAFETLLGLARDVPLSRIAAEYDVSRGSLWPVVPLATLLAPILVRRVQARMATPAEAT